MREALRPILITGTIVGVMDITSAIVMTIIRGSTAMRVLQFVASGLLGPRAFAGDWPVAALGLALHFVVAFAVVAVLYLASRRFVVLRDKPIASGLAYGVIVFAVMNLIVVPLSAAKPRHALVPDLIQLAIHMLIIGLPTALLLRRVSGANAR
jgi:hypothetical protein